MNLVNFGGLIGDAIADTWMSIWLSINSMVYSIIELLYKVFVAVANVNLFGEDVFNKIVKRVYIVMAIAMLFIFAYNLVLMIINPDDKKSTGQMTKMIKETIISLVLIVLLPTIFNYMSIFQRHVLDSNILGQIILGDVGGIASKDELTTYCEKYKKYTIIEDKTDIGDRRYNWGYVVGGTAAGAVGGAGVGALIGGGAGLIASLADYFSQEYKNANEELFKGCLLFNAKSASSRGAATIAPTIFSAFYHPTNYGYFECADFIENGVGKYDSYTTNYIKTEDDKKMCSYYYYSVNMAKFTGSISAFNEESYFYSKVKKDEGTFEFNYILALVAGVLAVYMFACYTMSIGVRVAKLGFLQIISPLTVMMRIIPKKKEAIYDKWQKMLLDTYLDVFIRLLIIYFSLFSISLVPDVIHTLFSSFEGGGITGALVNSLACVVVILGILKFAQDAPGLFKEFFGGSGSFALKSPKKQLNENKYAKGIIGATTGSAIGFASGIAKKKPIAAVGGIFRGAKNGARNMADADLTKKSSFSDSIKNSKYKTDYEQNHTKFQAIRSGVQQKGGIEGYIKSKGTDFIDFLKDTNNQSEKFGAANKLFTDSAIINNMIIDGIVKEENNAKEAWAANKPIALGDNYYRRDDTNGVWVDSNGKEYVKSEMKTEMDTYYKKTKVAEMADALAKNNKNQQLAFKQWSEDFNKTMIDNFPKLATSLSDSFFKTISAEGGIEVKDLNDLMTKMESLQRKGALGDKNAYEQLASLKVAMDKGFKNMKDSSYDMNPKK